MKHLLFLLTAVIAVVNASAQKLPNKQEGSLKAPANVKVDGKLNEWGELKAYNSATGLFYTLANDEQNLYLAIRINNKPLMAKIFGAGISLAFKPAGNAAKKEDASINFLAFPKDNRFAIDELLKDTVANDLKVINKAINAALKTIIVKNLDDVKGDSISVYNDYGIMAASYLNDTKNYTCEIAIPLKHLKSFISTNALINYTLQANAVTLSSMKVVMNGKVVDNASASPQIMEMMNRMSQADKSGGLNELMNDTNVSGQYTLAK